MIHTFHNTLLAWWYPVLYIKLQKYGTESSQDIKESQTIKSFNKKLKDHLLIHS